MDVPRMQPAADYQEFPQRLHKYPASDRAKKIVRDSLTIDSLLGVTWPVQFSTPEGPEFHDVMAQVHKGGMKVLAAAISADSAGTDYFGALHIDHVVNLVGIDHVGFGSDWVLDVNQTATLMQAPIGQMFFNDGGVSMLMGKKGVPTPNPAQIAPALIDKLLEHGYTESDCKKFLGGNFYRVFKQVWR